VRQKPAEVQVVIRVMVTKASLQDPFPNFEAYTRKAINEWDELTAIFPDRGEISLALEVVERLRKQETCGQILRQNTQ
jgi:hypothetical protein